MSVPPLGGQWGGVFEAEGGRSAGANDENPVVFRVAAAPGYFEAIGMTLLDGRVFDERDSKPNAPPVVLVNETFAKHFWGNGSRSLNASVSRAERIGTMQSASCAMRNITGSTRR